ncbi:MAG: tetratricopeptide repeat protein [Lentisphaerae bacterium]|jgi:tetratricopeptide (TPR) repeat protein|nr:tetratricopeptide repeat protein [Lentisphaerota bacterium]MBT4818909.1 tetratricopeptide repeat protein [Lentisphaerota bacterium]MBT5612672.1 tetratricopeptide repeat protein [Lentisphaerota bacterium]MBT7056934.1 tetratricopeptide repeat protein [Lentisphaerota bacterium]MBT7841527.1 tetratricopeptide repeat protein [Lentisphaerota bacterium]
MSMQLAVLPAVVAASCRAVGCGLAASILLFSGARTASGEPLPWHAAVEPGEHPICGKQPELVLQHPEERVTPGQEVTQLAEQLSRPRSASETAEMVVDYPLDEAVFPPAFPPPTFIWHDADRTTDSWHIAIATPTGVTIASVLVPGDAPRGINPPDANELTSPDAVYAPNAYEKCELRWRPSKALWDALQRASRDTTLTLTVTGIRSQAPGRPLSSGHVRFKTASDPVGAPIFFRLVPLPFGYAVSHLHTIRWVLGDIESGRPPKLLLTNMNLCGNCHSFTPDGQTLAMDVDYGSDKGSYVISEIAPKTILRSEDVISWSDYRREDGEFTFGLLAKISPCGRYVISTVKDRSVFTTAKDLWYSQKFFPIKGVLVVHDRERKSFEALPGASDPAYVQSSPEWSPDGKTVLFSRAKAQDLAGLPDPKAVILPPEYVNRFFQEGKAFTYDIYRVPFNDGRGGKPEALAGASGNGNSNFFPRYSPDGKWVVFCRASTYMLLQPDSTLHIMPASGGTARKMRCNLDGKMNSWHSWSPNGRWLVFSSKAAGPFTQLWLTHVDAQGGDSPPVLLETLTSANRAANIPEFVNLAPGQLQQMEQQFEDAFMLFREGELHQRFGRRKEAIAAYRRVLKVDPKHGVSLYGLAECLLELNQLEEALTSAKQLLEVMPKSWGPYSLIGRILVDARRYKQARDYLLKACSINGRHPRTAASLAWLYATCPVDELRDGKRALDIAQKVYADHGETALLYPDILAAAWAESGDPAKAVDILEQATRDWRAKGQNVPPILERHLAVFRQGKPFRMPK